MLSYPVSFSSAVSIACFFSSYNWNHSFLNIRCGSGQVIIDFSTRETSLEVLSLAVKHQKALVCGTTGFSPEEMQQFQDAVTLIPMLYTANTSKLVKYNEQASGTGHFHTKKELATLFIVPPVPYIARTCCSPNGIAFFTGTLPFRQ